MCHCNTQAYRAANPPDDEPASRRIHLTERAFDLLRHDPELLRDFIIERFADLDGDN